MNATIKSNNVEVVKVKSFEKAEREACFETAEDWMYGESFEVDGVEYQYFIDPSTNQNVMLQITIDTISISQITQIYLVDGTTKIWQVEF